MSKTAKIRRLKNKVSRLERDVSVLEWSCNNLVNQIKPRAFKHYTQPPTFRSNNYHEEQSYQKLINYIYLKMDQLYNEAIDRDPYVCLDDIKFTLYLDRSTIYRLSGISGYRDFDRSEKGFTFKGHEVIEVLGDSHINFVRTA